MLRGIPPILSPDILWTLRAMGHGDVLAIVDANFPAEALGPRCLRLDGISATDLLEAVLALMPLDTFVDEPAHRMEVVGAPDEVPPVITEFQAIIDRVADAPRPLAKIERHGFYAAAKGAFAVIQTGETRLYGNVLLTKGVIAPG